MSAKNLCIYIDGNNLYRSAKELGFTIHYGKFRGWLRQKYNPSTVFIFIGYIKEREAFYALLKKAGFTVIFKQTLTVGGQTKGNCDAELVLKATSDFYTTQNYSSILITGDGDFGCLVEFFKIHHVIEKILAPDRAKCSFLLRNKNVEITFLNEHYHKFSIPFPIKEKAPGADVSAQGSL